MKRGTVLQARAASLAFPWLSRLIEIGGKDDHEFVIDAAANDGGTHMVYVRYPARVKTG